MSLLSLDDVLDHDGTEHLESSDIRQPEALFTNSANSIQMRLFPVCCLDKRLGGPG